MDGFDATTVELLVTGGQVRGIADDLRSELAALSRTVDALCDGAWRGRAAAAFGAGWDEWRTGALQVLEALETTGELLTATGRDYEAADAASADALRSVA